jgi:hypothetical protein
MNITQPSQRSLRDFGEAVPPWPGIFRRLLGWLPLALRPSWWSAPASSRSLLTPWLADAAEDCLRLG